MHPSQGMLRQRSQVWPGQAGGGLKPDRVTARTAGALFITATVASLLSTGFLNPILNNSDYLGKTFANQDRVIAGAFFLLVAAFASAGIAISLYPVLRRHAEGLALGSVCFRVMEGVLYLASAVSALLLVTLSEEFARAGTPGPSYFQASGALLRAFRDQTSLTGVLAFYLGALMYYYIFFRSRLIPRWLSAWGFAGAVLGLAAGLLVLFRATGFMSPVQVVLNLPIGVNEMVLAVWLIVAGFKSPAGAPVPAKPSGEAE
jgi:Domain of unknown function (DUF4386)